MGLDLLHVRLSAKDEHTPEFFTVEELDVFPGIVERHRDLITEIDDVESIFTIYLFSDEKDRQEYEWRKKENGNVVFLVGEFDNIVDEIFKIENDKGLGSMHRFITEIGGENRTEKDPVMIEYAETYTRVPVIYWKEIGYQRKGMDPAFYEAFENCKLYFRKEDVLRASTYRSGVDSKYYQRTFQEEFIDNFIEGESIFLASW